MPQTREKKPPRPAFNTYSLNEFQTAYDLTSKEAKDLFDRFGPSRAELDVLMKGVRNRGKNVTVWLA
jgi:hypothetical protein